MQHATSHELYRYWDYIRCDHPAPRADEIVPRKIVGIIADVFILQFVQRGCNLFRLAGTRICAAYCRELSGSNFIDLWDNQDRLMMAALAATVTHQYAAGVLGVKLRTRGGRELVGEILLLPLRREDQHLNRLLGSFATFERPFWYGADPAATLGVMDLRSISPVAAKAFSRSRFVPAPLGKYRRRGHLLLLDGGKGS